MAELLVIALVALVVLGPEHLPRVAIALGKLVGWCKQAAHTVQTELDNHLLHQELSEQEKKAATADKHYQQRDES